MKVPVSWLREYVDVRASADEIAERLAVSGLELEGMERRGAPDEGTNHEHFRFGRVVEWGKHPNADRLRLCRVDVGEAEPRQIVCGASNFDTGDVVVVALPGARLPGATEPLRRAKLRGEYSDGMMLSERELELSDDHGGIIVLPEGPEIGALVRDQIALAEVVLDLKVETNRGDCLSVYGVAREVATLFRAELAPPPGLEEPEATAPGRVEDVVRVAIEAPDRCFRFTARAFADVRVGPSPLWLRQRLAAAGVRPLSNVVDVTNYVTVGLGQPLHAYDGDKIPGRVLSARLARPGERVTTLDGRERELNPDILVIADGDGVSGIAGVMGGGDSEISEQTTSVVLEAANFERSGVQRTAAALALYTDASHRFARGVDVELASQGSRWAAELLARHGWARPLAGMLDERTRTPERETIVLRDRRVTEILGLEVDPAETRDILQRLGFEPQPAEGGHRVTVPSWRALDVSREIDLVEEVGRIHGLDRIPATLPRPETPGRLTRAQALRRRVEDALVGAGLHEAITVTLVPEDDVDRLGLAPDDPRRQVVRLADPLTAEHAVVRTTMLPSLLRAVRHNRHQGREDVALFEVAHLVRPWREDQELPDEPWGLAFVLAGRLGGRSWLGPGLPADVLTAKGVLGVVLDRLGVPWSVEAASPPHLTPGRAATVLVGGQPVGELGELHPHVAARFELEGTIAVAEIDLDAVVPHVPARVVQRRVPSFPPVLQDVAVVVDATVPAAALVATAERAGAPLLRSVTVFDRFADEARLGAGKVSVGLRLAFGADDRTLTEDEASARREAITAALAEEHGARLRD